MEIAKIKIFLAAVLATSALGCAGKQIEKDLQAKLAQEPPVANTTELSSVTDRVIQSEQNLTEAQRAQLAELEASTSDKLRGLQQQSLQLRAILVKDLVAAEYNESEVKLIKKNLSQIEDKRTALLIDSVEQTNSILGRKTRSELSFGESDWADHIGN